jgi:GMP synthase (glutamine-hydrolysing)
VTDPHAERILILDFGSQYTQLIARRIREVGVYSEIYAFDAPVEAIKSFAPRGIILSGGPESVTLANTPRAPQAIFDMEIPVLGICYGMQTMAAQLGGEVDTSAKREYGRARVEIKKPSAILTGMAQTVNGKSLETWMSHGDKVSTLPPGFEIIASSNNAPLAAIADEKRRFFGLQFHPEVTHTPQGQVILEHFAHQICGCRSLWNPGSIIQSMIEQVQRQVGDDEVLLALSGGVDSSVTAALLHRAIDQRLTCIFVDNGLLRLNEGDQVMATFSEHMGIKVDRVDAADRFLSALKGVADPEQKRKIIGRNFIEIFEQEAKRFNKVKWLAQGTIYPDVIESAGSKTGKAHVIKSHHNVGGLPERMHLKLLEPLRELFKDEVRRIGEALGLPHRMLYRHPFPGPGLGVRILGEVKKEYADILRQADAIYIQELENSGYYDKVSQAFTVFLPVKSVGVVGDQRAYDYVVAIRAVETVDFMTANWAPLPHDLLSLIAHRIINEVRGVARVVYDISGKPPATIEWE